MSWCIKNLIFQHLLVFGQRGTTVPLLEQASESECIYCAKLEKSTLNTWKQIWIKDPLSRRFQSHPTRNPFRCPCCYTIHYLTRCLSRSRSLSRLHPQVPWPRSLIHQRRHCRSSLSPLSQTRRQQMILLHRLHKEWQEDPDQMILPKKLKLLKHFHFSRLPLSSCCRKHINLSSSHSFSSDSLLMSLELASLSMWSV